eukprot:jgi/Phyca11/116423/e_gw1.30.510.1
MSSSNRIDTVCAWCGRAPCAWAVYEEALKERAKRMQSRLTCRRRHHALRNALGRIYVYLHTGKMKGTLSVCASKRLLQLWPDNSKCKWVYCICS